VARELGAQYVVEGSVQKTEDRVRITAQLIDANTGHHVWSDRYDRDLKDIFALQDEITMKIMAAVGMKLVDGEQYGEKLTPPSGSLEVLMKTMKAREYISHFNKEDNILARQELEAAIVLDPDYSLLYSLLATTHLADLTYQSSESHLVSIAQASKDVKRALALDNEDWMAHVALSYLYLVREEHDKAISAAERAIALNPNGTHSYAQLGLVLMFSARAEEGIAMIKKSMRLNPIPDAYQLDYLGCAYRFVGRYDDAIEVHREVLRRSPNNVFTHVWLTAAYSASGREDEARQQAEQLLGLDPTFTLEQQLTDIRAMKDKAEVERFIADLRKAGLK
jgi:adenylate cyclase